MKLLHTGFRNYVNEDRVHAIVQPNTAPVKRNINNAADKETLIDCTMGRKTRSVIYTDEYVILSSIATHKLKERNDLNDS